MQMGRTSTAADLYGLPRPPRIPRSAAKEQLSLMLLSFMSESRRLDNQRMLRELGCGCGSRMWWQACAPGYPPISRGLTAFERHTPSLPGKRPGPARG